MPTIPEALAIAVQHHQAGRLPAAEQIYRQILAVEPNHVDALHLLGVIARQMGQHEIAIEYIGRAIQLKSTEAVFHSNLGNAFKGQGKLDEAVACYRRALKLKPDDADASSNLGVALQGQGKLDEAVACFRRALQLKPDHAVAHNNLGNALRDQGKLDEAVACCRRALELKPDFVEAHNNLGNALNDQGKLDEAVACFRRALLKPDFAQAHNNLGNALRDQGKLEEAVACCRRALELKLDFVEAHNNLGNALNDQGKIDEAVACFRRALLKPDFAEAHNNLGKTFNDQGKLEEAVDCFHRALELKPDFVEAHNNLGNALKDQGKMDEAVACYQRALQLKPDYTVAHNNLGNAFKDQGKIDEAVACYQRALELAPDYALAHSNFLYALQYRVGANLSELAAAHAEYDRQRAEPLRTPERRHESSRDRQRRIRVGFISPDFGRHPVGQFLIRVMENLDRGQWDYVCYCDRRIKDDLTMRFQAAATTWRDVIGLSDKELAEAIRADGIDILVDLAGHTARNRMLVFARKPSPIQVTWMGYEGTTGLEAIDYILADRYTIPPGHEVGYRERVLRMPDGYVCYDPPTAAPNVGPLPAMENDFIRFGSFNNPAKMTPQVVKVWTDVLHRVPQSRLVLKYRGMGSDSVHRRYTEMFTSFGVHPARLEFAPWSDYADYLAAYRQIDIALDPFPFGGGITTCDALWMGVPVVTCPGETFASRHGLSHLSNIGLTETVAHDFDEYIQTAVSLAGDLPRLAALRADLRERMAASPLCDGKRFAANLESVLRDVWCRWCEKEPAEEPQSES